MNATLPRSRALAAALPLLLAALVPAPAGAATPEVERLANLAYLARVTADADPQGVYVRLRVRGETVPQVSFRPGIVQVTLPHAFLDPAKQRVAVEESRVREVIAYQLDPETVRVRVLADGVTADALADATRVTAGSHGLRLTLRGLPAPAPPALPRPAPTAVARAAAPALADAPPEAAPETSAPSDAAKPAPKAAAPTWSAEAAPFPPAGPDTARLAEDARADALMAFERILADGGDGAGDPALPAPSRLALLPEPDGRMGGGMAAEPPAAAPASEGAGATQPAAEAVTEAPLPAAPQEAPAPAAQAPAPKTETSAPAETGGLLPLKHLPASGEGAPTLWSSGVKMAGGLLTVLALLLAGVAAMRRVRGAGLGARVPIRVLASASLGGRQNIVVVEVEGRRLVVGVGPGGTELLATLDGEAPAGPGDLAAPSAPERGAATVPSGRRDTPFARALKRAGRSDGADAVARTTRQLQRQVRLLQERSA